MESTDGKSGSSSTATNDKECVKVAVNVRPLITAELLVGCTDCITVARGEPQVHIGSHSFTFDHVYGSAGSSCSAVFDDCVAPLVDALFHGYNATVLAYGQTGSGKTYTMGTNYTELCVEIFPCKIEDFFPVLVFAIAISGVVFAMLSLTNPIGWRMMRLRRELAVLFSGRLYQGCKLIGCGSAVPKLKITNDDLAQIVETNDKWIATRTGIRNRRVLSGMRKKKEYFETEMDYLGSMREMQMKEY